MRRTACSKRESRLEWMIATQTVAHLAGAYVIAVHLRLLGGISNLTKRHYYSRVFLFGGMLEPANDRSYYAGAAYDF